MHDGAEQYGNLHRDLMLSAEAAIDWLCLAQDNSASADGGVSRDFSPIKGWETSYPETTGYIIPTLISYAKLTKRTELLHRSRVMLDWLVSIQFPGGGFQGGRIDSSPLVPVSFNTGQILLGLAAGMREFGSDYRGPLVRAANWLVSTQDANGCWRRFPTPFACPGVKTYETHTAWGLLEAARAANNTQYARAALANINWALSLQRENGWVPSCCLVDNKRPLTHTLGYFLRGVLEGFVFSRDQYLLEAALKTGRGLLRSQRPDGALPGQLDRKWRSCSAWTCLTGNVQIAHCWLLLYQATGLPEFQTAAHRAILFVQRTMKLSGPRESIGAVAGSFPFSGAYLTNAYPSWAAKFFIDAALLAHKLYLQDASGAREEENATLKAAAS